MRITEITNLSADAGGRNFDFLKVATDASIVGWSEYNESFGGPGIAAAIAHFAPAIVGRDPRTYGAIVASLNAAWRQTSGGAVAQAIGAIENALLDITAKAFGVPVYELLGGRLRDRVHLYWSHCGMYRLQWAEEMQLPPVRTLEDLTALGREVAESGFTALKTNAFLLDGEPRVYRPGFGGLDGFPDLNADRSLIATMREQLAALREGTGPDVDILVDLNFNFKTEGFARVARAVEEFDVSWIEMDIRSPEALRFIRESTSIPVASCECLLGRRDFRPYFEQGSVDVAIVDAPMNGVAESVKIANAAETYEINVAPHNFYGPLATLMSAHFCAAVPNVRTMEIDVDTVPWHGDLVTEAPRIESGHLVLPDGPGWGADVDEDVVRRHPPRPPATSAIPAVEQGALS